ncbi:hypothetical protein [Chryseobacterium lactis]|uniref:hypothetical protein n=1 Tax=Chryseobacterium lactis TaxID=1241981 RepID=UPI001629B5B1|nr:hypothetical protein [Chryseobacterium lactis]
MKEKSNKWPYKWFGFWKEYGEEYIKYPSIKYFINEEINKTYEKEKLLNYLNKGLVITVTSKSSFPDPFTSVLGKGEISIKTDGKWLWLENIYDFIEFNNLIIPSAFYKDIQDNNFILPEIEIVNFEALEWPSL